MTLISLERVKCMRIHGRCHYFNYISAKNLFFQFNSQILLLKFKKKKKTSLCICAKVSYNLLKSDTVNFDLYCYSDSILV